MLSKVNVSFAIGGQATQRHLQISRPLGDEGPVGIENLNAATAVFADIDIALAVGSDAARVSHHAGADALAAKIEHDHGKRVSRIAGPRAAGSATRCNRTGKRTQRLCNPRDGTEHPGQNDDHDENRNQYREPNRF